MSQQYTPTNIDIGATANDGLGNTIRASFGITNNNFAKIFSLPQGNVPNTFMGKPGDIPGMYAYSSTSFYYCYGTYTGNSTIWAEVGQTSGPGNAIANGTSNVFVSANGNVTVRVSGSQVATFGNTGLSVTGAVRASEFFGDGSGLTNLPQSYTNANVTGLLPVYSGNLSANNVTTLGNVLTGGFVCATGNVRGGNVNTVGNVSAAGFIIGNAAYMTGLPATYTNANVAAYLPTYNGGFTSLTGAVNTTSTISADGNITTAGYFVGQFAGTVTGTISNVPGGNTQIFYNDGGNLGASGGFTFNSATGSVGVIGSISAQGNIQSGNVIATNFTYPNGITIINTYSNANVAAYLPTYNGNVTANNILTNNYYYANGQPFVPGTYSNANVAAYLPTYSGSLNEVVDVVASGIISVSQTITGGNLVSVGTISGNGNNISNIRGVNVVGSVANATYATTAGTAAVTSAAGTVTTNAQPNITSVGILSTLSVTGNVWASQFVGNGAALTSITGTNISGPVTLANTALISSTVTTGAQPNITSVGLMTSLSVTGLISTAGTVVGGIVSGDGHRLANITGSNINGAVATANVATTVSANAQPNITSVGTLTTLSVTGAVAGASLTIGDWTISQDSNGNLQFSAANTVMSITQDGNLSVTQNITAYSTQV